MVEPFHHLASNLRPELLTGGSDACCSCTALVRLVGYLLLHMCRRLFSSWVVKHCSVLLRWII